MDSFQHAGSVGRKIAIEVLKAFDFGNGIVHRDSGDFGTVKIRIHADNFGNFHTLVRPFRHLQHDRHIIWHRVPSDRLMTNSDRIRPLRYRLPMSAHGWFILVSLKVSIGDLNILIRTPVRRVRKTVCQTKLIDSTAPTRIVIPDRNGSFGHHDNRHFIPGIAGQMAR